MRREIAIVQGSVVRVIYGDIYAQLDVPSVVAAKVEQFWSKVLFEKTWIRPNQSKFAADRPGARVRVLIESLARVDDQSKFEKKKHGRCFLWLRPGWTPTFVLVSRHMSFTGGRKTELIPSRK